MENPIDLKFLRIGNYVEINKRIVRLDVKLFHAIIHGFEGYVPKPIPISEQWLKDFKFNKQISYWIETSEDKQFSVAWNDVGIWYAFSTNLNKGKLDDVTCLRSDLRHIHQLQNLVLDISDKELIK